jgi:hypothetical protein
MPPHKSTKAELKLIRENDGRKTTICCLRRELANKQGHVQRLEYLLCSRIRRTDELFGKLEQAYTINRRLEQECEHLATLVAASPATATAVTNGSRAPAQAAHTSPQWDPLLGPYQKDV